MRLIFRRVPWKRESLMIMNGIERNITWHYPFIMGMRGRLGNRVYYMRDGKIRARRHVIPANPRTEKQQTHRERFAEAVRTWRGLDNDARARWNARAVSSNRTGYNLFIGEFMAHGEEMRERVMASVKAPRQPRRTVRVVRRGTVAERVRVFMRFQISSPRAPAQVREVSGDGMNIRDQNYFYVF